MRKNIKIVVVGIKKIEGKYYNCGGGNKKIEETNGVKKDSLLSLTILIVFFQIAVYLTRFVLAIISRLIN